VTVARGDARVLPLIEAPGEARGAASSVPTVKFTASTPLLSGISRCAPKSPVGSLWIETVEEVMAGIRR